MAITVSSECYTDDMRADGTVNDSTPKSLANANALEAEMAWFSAVLDLRHRSYLAGEPSASEPILPEPPTPDHQGAYLTKLVHQHQFGFAERLVMALALVPEIAPERLDPLLVTNTSLGRRFTEFGGTLQGHHGGLLPTIETALFLLSGRDLAERFGHMALFEPDHPLHREGILRLEGQPNGAPFGEARLRVTEAALRRLTIGSRHRPAANETFPASRVTTELDWDDLVLPRATMAELEAINTWIQHGERIFNDEDLGRIINAGYRSLFHGPPGTGKTLAATLLGQAAGLDVYRVDLSMTVSKYIGETEKNLALVFDQARRQDWILFFDEADALFGKRSATNSAHDRYANQEVSYLLQRIEDYEGVVVLASNFKGNIDDAFARRFQSFVFFPMPDAEARLQLWRKMVGRSERLSKDVDLDRLADMAELSGGAIVNAIRTSAITALQRGDDLIRQQDLERAIAKELRKEGRSL